jgi:hypothetical protein
MIGLNNADSSFFNIFSPDVPLDYNVLSDDIVNFSITEEIGKTMSGNLTLYDPNSVYSRLLRTGIRLWISWGYKDVDDNLRTLLAFNENPLEVSGVLARTNVFAYIMSPSGGGDDKGYTYYNCSFYGTEYSGTKIRKVYSVGTKASIVSEVFGQMGVRLFEINFRRGNETINRDTQITQYGTNFKFLQKYAREWRCIFRIGQNSAGLLYGMFVDHDKFVLSQFQKIVSGSAFGNSIHLNYKFGVANVKSYTWKNHAGEGGSGDHVKLVMINGKTTFIRYIAERETVRAYIFRPEKITSELRRTNQAGGLKSMNDYAKWALNVTDFQSLVGPDNYFVPYTESTAPQGLGYSVSLNLLGNPMITSPMEVKFGRGFPDNFNSKQFKMFLRKVTHSIDRNGYAIQADAMDTLTYTGGSFI